VYNFDKLKVGLKQFDQVRKTEKLMLTSLGLPGRNTTTQEKLRQNIEP